ncbi:hypothetical protein F0562_000210 [Nyssa sinensis]|uniref:SAGA-associated factor 11 n=1 Tax=Nyssa sinensis TaxID=561372 RepID=A0A5J5BZ88_9ASTE|nr:hypothetical protein F0562_000210 [Nyssa sinensis]
MVCPLGSGRMAAMARLLAAGSFSQTIAGYLGATNSSLEIDMGSYAVFTEQKYLDYLYFFNNSIPSLLRFAEEVGHQKLTAQYIQRELREADEANLLDEEDMHVFDLKPMTDPLHLVCCNACKKPVKASQYASHAELCRSLNSAEEAISELDGGTGHKKPPRKERKKLLTAYPNLATSVGEQERVESIDAEDGAASESHLDEQVQMTSFVSIETKRNSSFVDVALIMDGSGPGNTDYSAVAMPPPTKRSKLIAAEAIPISDPLGTASGVTRSFCITTQEALTCTEFPKGSSTGSEKTCDHAVEYQKARHVHEYCLLTKDVPVPLATKMFYSQRNHRLRSALSHLYYESLNREHCVDLVNTKVLQGNTIPFQTSSAKNFSREQIGEKQNKKQRDKCSLPSVQNPDQILAQSSEVYLGKSGVCPPAMNFSNQVPVNGVLRPHTVPVGMKRSNYVSKPYTFAGNSGSPYLISL